MSWAITTHGTLAARDNGDGTTTLLATRWEMTSDHASLTFGGDAESEEWTSGPTDEILAMQVGDWTVAELLERAESEPT